MPKTAGVRALELPDQRGGVRGDQGGTAGDGREAGAVCSREDLLLIFSDHTYASTRIHSHGHLN
jgi:hypothetical protein